MTVEQMNKYFEKYAIWSKKPDVIVIDVQEWDNKIVFYKKPAGLNKVAILDEERIKWKYYFKNWASGICPCYPVMVDMYEYKKIFSGDGKLTDLWIGNREDVELQIALSLKKEGKREVYNYATFNK